MTQKELRQELARLRKVERDKNKSNLAEMMWWEEHRDALHAVKRDIILGGGYLKELEWEVDIRRLILTANLKSGTPLVALLYGPMASFSATFRLVGKHGRGRRHVDLSEHDCILYLKGNATLLLQFIKDHGLRLTMENVDKELLRAADRYRALAGLKKLVHGGAKAAPRVTRLINKMNREFPTSWED